MRQDIPVRCFSISLLVLSRDATACRVLLLRRSGSTQHGAWCQIAGGIEPGESAWQTARREAQEETGLRLTQLYSADICEQFYEADRNAITLAPVFVAYVDAGSAVTLNHEHSEYYWATFDEAQQMLPFPGQHRTLQHVRRYFADSEPNAALLMPGAQD
ncbi:NUDIX hydrolase [Musicola paradisiaca]|uniref:NUDIX hydrolase n=1 Tax=Musicola paradisiaca (strain Ech703) TaxID=579405 RepID=C6CBJ0_MUSP7|nr:NUDIX domain-containing protein [Musicola paradisiaca]ACS84775.1 NUDIX hydrolase [Musicola paradisiaca Ech703]